jgi:hypothetical protein
MDKQVKLDGVWGESEKPAGEDILSELRQNTGLPEIVNPK